MLAKINMLYHLWCMKWLGNDIIKMHKYIHVLPAQKPAN